MYEELVKRLRYRADREDDYYKHGGDIINEAADAIEELSREIDIDNAAMTAMDAAIPRWIPVTKGLPDEKQAEDVLCWITDGDPKAEGYCVSGCYNTLTKSWNLDSDWVDPWKITHWMPAPQGPKPAEDTNAPTGPYDLLYEEGGANTT